MLDLLYRRSKQERSDDPKAAQELIRTGITPVPEDLDKIELATWTTIARALLNLNETITRN